jgi:hypothetical protein
MKKVWNEELFSYVNDILNKTNKDVLYLTVDQVDEIVEKFYNGSAKLSEDKLGRLKLVSRKLRKSLKKLPEATSVTLDSKKKRIIIKKKWSV